MNFNSFIKFPLMVRRKGYSTSVRRSSSEAVVNVGTRSEPFMTVVIKCLPDSANSNVIQAAANDNNYIQAFKKSTLY